MEINFDPRDLTQQQRDHVAAFLTQWPVAKHGDFDLSKFAHLPRKSDMLAATGKSDRLTDRSELVTFGGKTEAELLADEHAADMQPTDAADDNTDKASAEAAFTPSATPDRDGEGLPWDRRIHSSSKALNADGRWRIARNVAPELIESVKAELRVLVAAPVAVDAAQQAVVAVAPPPPGAQVTIVTPPPPDVAVVAPPPPPVLDFAALAGDTPAPDLNVMFTALLRDAGQAVVAQRITSAELTAICVKHGVANVGLLASRKDLVPQIDAEFRALLASKVQP